MAHAHRSAHAQPRRDLRATSSSGRRPRLDAGRAGAAHRRAGGAGVRPAAAERPLPADLRHAGRAAGAGHADAVREFTQRCTDVLEMYVRRQPELWLWMHRRWRDAPAPETRGMFPVVRDDGGARCLTLPSRVVVAAPNWLGDAVMALPALGAVRAFAPRRTSPWRRARASPPSTRWCRTWTRSCRWRRARRSPARRVARDAARLADGRFDLAVLFPNSFLSAWIASKAGIRERWGYAAGGRGRLLTRPVRRPGTLLHQADYYLAPHRGARSSGGAARQRRSPSRRRRVTPHRPCWPARRPPGSW